MNSLAWRISCASLGNQGSSFFASAGSFLGLALTGAAASTRFGSRTKLKPLPEITLPLLVPDSLCADSGKTAAATYLISTTSKAWNPP